MTLPFMNLKLCTHNIYLHLYCSCIVHILFCLLHILNAPYTCRTCMYGNTVTLGNTYGSVVAKKLGCRLKIKFRRLKEELNCPLCFTDSSPAKNPAGNLRFFSR